MRFWDHPAFIGGLVVGIIFNLMLGILGLIGLSLLDALYITATFLTIIGAVIVQYLLDRRKDN